MPSSPSRESRSRSRSRLRTSSPSIPISQPFIGQPEELVVPDGPISGQAAELLHEFVHPHHPAQATETTLVEEEGSEEDDLKRRTSLPWWKRPSPWWYATTNSSTPWQGILVTYISGFYVQYRSLQWPCRRPLHHALKSIQCLCAAS